MLTFQRPAGIAGPNKAHTTHTRRALPQPVWLRSSTFVQSAVAMAAPDESSEDVFEVAMTMKVKNAGLGVDATIQPAFIKLMDDGSRFVSLDFYQSRGGYSLLTSRLPPKPGRHYGKLVAKVVGKLKRLRDDAFRKSLLADAPVHLNCAKCRGPSSITPKNRELNAIALSKNDVVEVEMDAIEDEFEGYCLSCAVCLERHNGNTELWVDAQSSMWYYMSRLVAHEYRNSPEGKGEAHAPVDSPNTATAPIAETPIATGHSPKRQSRDGDGPWVVECASPAKRQTTLLSFRKPST